MSDVQSKGAAAVEEECDHEGSPPPLPKRKRGTKRGQQTAEAAGEPEKKAPVRRGKKAASPEPQVASEDEECPAEEPRKRVQSGRGRKRKYPQPKDRVSVAAPIRVTRQTSAIIPQASYPAALGYSVGNGESEDVAEPKRKRPRQQAPSSSRKQQSSSAATAKKKSPVKPGPQKVIVFGCVNVVNLLLYLPLCLFFAHRMLLGLRRQPFLVRTELDVSCMHSNIVLHTLICHVNKSKEV